MKHRFVPALLAASVLEIYQWIEDNVRGEPTFRREVDVTRADGITERNYFEAFPVRVTAFNPLLIMSNGLAPATIEMAVQANRMEHQ